MLPRITDVLHDDPACPYCRGEGMVCEDHPGRPWGPMIEAEPDDGAEVGPQGGCWCGAPGAECPRVPG
jgi:hypothetical protein